MDKAEHYNVIVIGAGPAGVGAAVALTRHGVKNVAVIERNEKIGGIPSLYKRKNGGVRTFIRWSRGGVPVFGSEYAGWLEKKLYGTSAQVKLQTHVTCIDAEKKMITCVDPSRGRVLMTADAIIMACGSREKTQSERGWIAGSRPARVLFTKQLLDLVDGQDVLPFENPVIIGSDLLACAAAAKLSDSGISGIIMFDRHRFPQASVFERLYFSLRSNTGYRRVGSKTIEIAGRKTVSGVKVDGKIIPCDGVVICGELVPNSELALLGDLRVDTGTRIPVVEDGCRLSEPGWFVAGNIRGGFHGAEWCYFNGCRVAKNVIRHINN